MSRIPVTNCACDMVILAGDLVLVSIKLYVLSLYFEHQQLHEIGPRNECHCACHKILKLLVAEIGIAQIIQKNCDRLQKCTPEV